MVWENQKVRKQRLMMRISETLLIVLYTTNITKLHNRAIFSQQMKLEISGEMASQKLYKNGMKASLASRYH